MLSFYGVECHTLQSLLLCGESRTEDSPWGEYASCSVTSPSRGRNRATAVYNIGDMALPVKSRCSLDQWQIVLEDSELQHS
jgi:hypothetical protein